MFQNYRYKSLGFDILTACVQVILILKTIYKKS